MPASTYASTSAYSASGTAALGRVSQPAPTRPDPCADPAPACPVCGGLKCLCRPRFFPGQLLSDDDLNRLQQYIIDKNRLHNRYLVGWGVACGLEVVCSPCQVGEVTVRSGYALSPCGDDIVLCGDQSVNVCELIQRCRPQAPVECEQPYGTPPTPCRTDIERWVLAVCYDEKPSRGITALTGAGDSIANPGCRCGGSAGCGCGGCNGSGAKSGCSCGGSGSSSGCSCGAKTSAYQPTAKRLKLLPQCEPTQVCEGFRFTAYKAPLPQKGLAGLPDRPAGVNTRNDLLIAWLYANRSRFGPLLERLLCCVLQAMDLRASLVEGRATDSATAIGVYVDYAQALQNFAAEFTLHHCQITTIVRGQYDDAVGWTRSRVGTDLNSADRLELATRTRGLDDAWMQIATECFCSALLPACPRPSNDNCVPLAVITVRNGTRCEVRDICNWQERKLLITWPTILYWLSWLPWQSLRDWIARICCEPDRRDTAYTLMTVMLGVAVAGISQSSASTKGTPFIGNLGEAGTAGGSASGANAGTAAAGPGGVAAPPAPAPQPTPAPAAGSFDAAMQSDNLLLHMLGDFEAARSGQATQPMWSALAARVFDGTAFAPLASNAALREVDVADVQKRIGVDALREQVAALQQTVQRQDEVLRSLQIIRGQQG
jgi:hypothetical protein